MQKRRQLLNWSWFLLPPQSHHRLVLTSLPWIKARVHPASKVAAMNPELSHSRSSPLVGRASRCQLQSLLQTVPGGSLGLSSPPDLVFILFPQMLCPLMSTSTVLALQRPSQQGLFFHPGDTCIPSSQESSQTIP